MRYDGYGESKRYEKIEIFHEPSLNTLVKFVHDMVMESESVAIQYLYDHDDDNFIDILIKFEKVSKYKYYRTESISIVLIITIIWQYVHDIIFFINFVNLPDTEGVDNWNRYQCYGYILTNSSVMKQYNVFLLCKNIFGSAFEEYKKSRITGKIFIILMQIHYTMLLPILLTHYFPGMMLYCWFWFGGLLIGGMIYYYTTISRNILQKWIFPIIYPILYILFILFPVIMISRFYEGDYNYIYCLISPFNDRNVNDSVNNQIKGWTNSHFSIQQLFVWLF